MINNMMRTLVIICFSAVLLFAKPVVANNIKIVKSKGNISSWLVEEHSLPILSIKIAFKLSGGSYDPDGKEGLSYFASTLFDEGAGNYKSLEFQKQLEKNAIHLSASPDKDYFFIDLKTLTKNRNKAFNLLSLALTQPRFDDQAVDRLKRQIISVYHQNMESPGYIASVAWNQTTYGEHPYSKELRGNPDSIKSITREDLVTWFKKHINKENMYVSVVGDISEEELKSSIERYLDQIQEEPSEKILPIKEFMSFPKSSTKHISKPNPQTTILFGMPGVTYNTPDFYPAYIMNYILGGGSFQSRLVDEIREKRGLAYSASSYISSYEFSGALKGSIGTKYESVAEVLSLLKNELKKITESGVTEYELEDAKSYLTGSFALKMDTNPKLVNFLTVMQIEDLGIDFLERRNDMVNIVTLGDIDRVAKKLLGPDKLTIITVGK